MSSDDWSDLGNKAETWTDLGTPVPEKKRTDGERLADNFKDGALRNPTVADARRTYSNPLSALPLPPMMKPGGLLMNPPSILDIVPGLKAGVAIKGVMDRALGLDAPAGLDAKKERERRDAYNARSEADPFYKAGDNVMDKAKAGLATLGGQLLGGLTDPQNLVAPGKTVGTRILGAMGANAGGDYVAQQSDLKSGVQDRYVPEQTVAAAALGGIIQSGVEGGAPLARSALNAAKPKIDAAKAKVGEVARDVGNRLDRIGDRPIASRANDTDWSDLGAVVETPTPRPAPEPKAPKPKPAPQAETPIFREADARAIIKGIGGKVTSGYRTPEHNAEVGGVKGSYHTRGRAGDAQAIDVTPPKGMTMADLATSIRARMPGAKVINEGDHVHVQWGRGTPAPRGRPTSLADDLEAGLKADEDAVRVTEEADAPAPGPARSADRPSSDGSGTLSPRAGDEAAPSPARDDEPVRIGHIDDNHARLYDLGKKAEAGELDAALADDLAKRMSPLIDWTDEPNLTKRERAAIRRGEPVAGRRMIEVAKDYARRFDEHGPEAKTSFYDPDKYHAAMFESRTQEPSRVVDDNPIPETVTPTPRAPEPEPRIDLTDRALDYIRRGKSVRPDRGQTLIQWLEKTGLKDEGNELSAMDADLWHRDKPFRRKIVRANGRSLDDAAVAAQEAGFLPERFGDTDTRATPGDLLDAIRDELAGNPRYARDDVDGDNLRQHADEIEEVMHEAGIDPTGKTNAEIKAEIDAYFRQPASAGVDQPKSAVLGQGGSTVNAPLSPSRDFKPVSDAKGGAYNGETVSAVIADLRRSLNSGHRQGRLRSRKAAGEFNIENSSLRTKKSNDLPTFAHELGHHIEFHEKPVNVRAAMEKHAKLLKTFDYDGKKKRRFEGFAEWFRKYITDPAEAKALAPEFHADFEAALAKDMPKQLKAFHKAQADFETMVRAPSTKVLTGRMKLTDSKDWSQRAFEAFRDRGVGGAISDFLDSVWSDVADKTLVFQFLTHKLDRVHTRNYGKPMEIKDAENPHVHARLMVDYVQKGLTDVFEGVTPYRGTEAEGPSLSDAIQAAFGKKWTVQERAEFGAYLTSRSLIDDWKLHEQGEMPGKPDLYSRDYHEKAVAEWDRDNPTWAKAAEMVYEFQHNLALKDEAVGFRKAGTADEWRQRRPNYVPVKRSIADKIANGANDRKAPGNGAGGDGIKKRGGSDRDPIDPFMSMMERSISLSRRSGLNEIAGTMRALGDRAGPGSAEFIELLPKTQLKAFQINFRQALEKKMKEADDILDFDEAANFAAAAERLMSDSDLVTIFKAIGLKPRPDERVIMHWENGDPHPILLPDGKFGKQLFEAFSGMTPAVQSKIVDVIAMGTTALRMGALRLNPEFAMVNPIRDTFDFSIKMEEPFIPVVSTLRGAASLFTDKALVKRARSAGYLGEGIEGMASGLNPRNAAEASRMVGKLSGTPLREVLLPAHKLPWRVIKGTATALGRLVDFSEQATRIEAYRLGEVAGKKQGLTPYEASIKGAMTRDAYDPKAVGAKMLTAARLAFVLNAYLQSLSKYARIMTGSGYDRPRLEHIANLFKPAKTAAQKRRQGHALKAWTMTVAFAGFAALNTYNLRDDDEYKSLGSFARTTNFVVRVGPGPDGLWKLPIKPHDVAPFLSLAERLVEKEFGDGAAKEKLFDDWMVTMIPPHSVPFITAPLDQLRNKNFAGRQIVPDYMKRLHPEQQYAEYTSRVAREIGKQMKWSPLVVDHYFSSFFGGAGRLALMGADRAINKAEGKPETDLGAADTPMLRRLAVDPYRNTVEQDRFYNLVAQNGGKYVSDKATFDNFVSNHQDAEALELVNSLTPQARAYVLATSFTKDGSSKYHPLARVAEIAPVLSQMMRETRAGTLSTIPTEANPRSEEIDLTPTQRRAAIDALEKLRVYETRNALIAIGDKGYAEREPANTKEAVAELRAVDPRLLRLLIQRTEGIPSEKAMAEDWSRKRAILEAPATAARLNRAIAAKRARSSDKETKARERYRLPMKTDAR